MNTRLKEITFKTSEAELDWLRWALVAYIEDCAGQSDQTECRRVDRLFDKLGAAWRETNGLPTLNLHKPPTETKEKN